ncbi:MAG: hypothetical protein L0Y72_32170 [Gemmataceae bacterium]|nr:hypothetical protein [Gemmataceae bacterium]MCI0743712.1 hypothetical protein [Gemmataceae bacterium]
MSALLDENMQLAKDAIKYVNKLSITSINVPFRITSYYGSPLSKFDMFLFCYMRAETDTSAGVLDAHTKSVVAGEEKARGRKLSPSEKQDMSDFVGQTVKDAKAMRSKILATLHDQALSDAEKKRRLKKMMEDSGFNANQFYLLTWQSTSPHGDEGRIRSVRRSIKFKHGNCGEKSAIAATWLLENTKNRKKIFWVGAQNWDHAWAVMGEPGKIDKLTVETGDITKWDEATVIADGWTGDWYPAKHIFNPIKGTFANPFQLYVRNKVEKASTQISCMEDCKWPPKFAPTFTLEQAPKKKSEYQSSPKSIAKNVGVADSPDELMDALMDELQRALQKVKK